ncbi:MAG: insulinase family protein [Planctomycetota bacterium]|nr:MAG: insulinase family protein [Planctomycetota bacterium]
MAAAATGAPARASAPLPVWAEAADVRLDNGLRVIVLPRDTPDRRVTLRLVVHAGTLHDPDGAVGAAHLVQHTLFDGSSRFPDGARAFLRSLGADPGSHETAYVAADHIALTVTLPGPAEGPLIRGLAFFADTLAGPTFPDAAVRTQRGVIADERRRGRSPEQRVFAAVIEGLAPGARLASRLAPQPPDAVERVTREDLVAFHRAWFGPANATVIIVGPVDPGEALGLARADLGAVPARPTPTPPDAGLTPTRGPGSIIATDPELNRFVAALIRLERPAPSALDEASFRAGLIDQTARRLLERRLEARAFAGDAAYTASGAYLGNALGAFYVAQLAVVADSDRARQALTDLLTERARLIEYGFTEPELDLARRAVLADARAVADRAATLDSIETANLITDQVLSGETLISPEDNLALVRRILPTVSVGDATRRCAELFADESCVVVVEGRPGGVPSEADVALVARRVEALPVSAPDAPAVLDALAEPASPPVPPESLEVDPAVGVSTAAFANGVVAHHKALPDAGRVILTLTFAGGELDETAATRGLTRAAAACFDRPAASGRDGLAVRDTLRVRGVDVSARVGIDTVSVTITAPADEARLAFELARLVATVPTLERAAFDQWRTRALAGADRRASSPRWALDDAVARAMSAEDDPRLVSLSRAQIESLTLDAARAWLARLVARSPVEVAVVGAIGRADAVRLASEYLGDLASRPAPAPGLARRVPTPARPPRVRDERVGGGELAAVAVGFRGPDAGDDDAVAALDLAARTLEPALARRLRDREGLSGPVRVEHAPARALPGFGVFLVTVTTPPADADRAARVIAEELAEFARNGPGSYDVALAQSQASAQARALARDPEHWSRLLARSSLRGRPIRTPDEQADRLTSVTPDAIRRAVADRMTRDDAIRVIVRPARGPAGAG